MGMDKFRIHKYTTVQNRNKKRQRGRGRPKKKLYWGEKRRRKAEKKKLENDKDQRRDDNVEISTPIASSATVGFDQGEEVCSLDPHAFNNENDNNNDRGGDGTDHHAQDMYDGIERVIADATQSQHLSLDRRMELVDIIYTLVHKCTGMIGGNGHGEAMYGEMIKSSIQRVVKKLMSDTGLSSCSRFLDVGCGLGKPQLHVAQMANVEFSYGIDIDELRVFLANLILRRIIKEARTKNFDINTRCLVMYGDIEVARVFDPFTHVYMFDVA